jgi:glycine cleavage system H protein
VTDSKVPETLRYTAEHEWIERLGPTTVRVGITDYAQDALGDVVFVQLPESGAEVTVGESFAEVESTKSVSDIYSPVAGRVSARNDALSDRPELINSDPYGEGWIVEITVADKSAIDSMLDAAAYQGMLQPH